MKILKNKLKTFKNKWEAFETNENIEEHLKNPLRRSKKSK